uniref:Peptidase A2 domain-containing protein n=1 Tax=Romanomermis culicivorax TaxID=13658 RepID=A0A915L845_ROMCU
MDSSRASSQSSELQLALPALPSSAIVTPNTPDTRVLNPSTSATNMVILSKEIASAAPIVSPGIICWNATGYAFQDFCHIHSSVCQIDNLMPSSKTFIRKYATRRAFQIPIKLGAVKAHALIDTGAQCSILSSGLVKPAFNKQSLQLQICGKLKVADGAVVNAHGPVTVTMESVFGGHMIKCVILDDDRNDQCIMGTDFLTHPDIHAISNFKENYIQIQDLKLPLKVIASVSSQTELFLNAANNNVLEEIPEEERALATQPTPNFCGYTLVSFHTQSIMAADMKKFQFAVPMPSNSTASSYPRYVQLTFPNGVMLIFETFATTPEDWTVLFSLVDGEHTIVVSFHGADDWTGIYALLGTQSRTDRQKKNKDPIVKAIHFDAYHVI